MRTTTPPWLCEARPRGTLTRPRNRLELVAHPDYVRSREAVLKFLYERHRFVEAA